MAGISFEDLVAMLEPYPAMACGFAAVRYELRVVSLAEALLFRPSSNRARTFDDCSKDGPRRANAYVDSFPSGPVFLIAFSLSTLARVFPEEWAGEKGDELVVWDGNHRLEALAVRQQREYSFTRSIGVFVGSY